MTEFFGLVIGNVFTVMALDVTGEPVFLPYFEPTMAERIIDITLRVKVQAEDDAMYPGYAAFAVLRDQRHDAIHDAVDKLLKKLAGPGEIATLIQVVPVKA